MGDFFYKTYLFIQKKKWTSLIALLLFVISLGGIASRIQFDDDITALIPANEESEKIQKVLKSIAFTDKIIVNIQRTEKGSIDDLTQYAANFVDSIQKNSTHYIKNIQGKLNNEDLPNTLNLVYENLPLFLEDADYKTITHKLSKDSITKQTEQNYRTLISPSGILAKKTIIKDPLGLSFIALKKLQQLGIGDNFKIKNGFLLDKKEQNVLLFLTPTFGSSDTDKNTALAANLYKLQEQLNTIYNGKIRGEYYGAALVAAANAAQIKHDIQSTVGIAMSLLLLIFVLFYRKLTIPIILFLPTIFGGLLSIALLFMLRAKISAISLGIGSVLLGITLDYSLHILTHIRNGNSLKNLYKEVAPSILMSSLTTALAFLCLLFLESQALQDLGIFAAASVLGASFFALLFIPQVYQHKVKNKKSKTFLDKIATYELHQNKWSIAVLTILLLISLFTYRTVIFNQDITKLNYESETLIAARERLEKLTDIGSKSIYLSTYTKNQEIALQRNDSVFHRLQNLKEEGKIISYSSIGALVKSNKKQQSKITHWNAFWNADKIERTKQNLIESGSSLGFKEYTFKQFYNLLEADFKPLKISDLDVVSSFAVDDFIVIDSISTTITSLIKVDDKNFETVKESFSKMPQTLLINRQQVNESLLGTLKNDFNKLIIYSLLVVLTILLLFYRSVSLTLVTSIPIFLTWLLTIGLMGLLKIEFNIFNIIISSFIFGVGIDYCLFITNGLLIKHRTDERAMPTHRTSIILSVITTILGIGALVFAKHPVLYTISVVSLIGIISAVFVAFTIQPLLFRLFIGSNKKRPIHFRYFVHSCLSFFYFGAGGFILSVYAWIVMKIAPKRHLKQNITFHKMVSKLMKSVLYTNSYVSKRIRNPHNETFKKPAMMIANHTSFLDILGMGMQYSKTIFLVADWVYNSPIFGSAAKLAGAYPVSGGIENGEEYLKQKVEQGFSLIAFPEGTRSTSNKIKRFHKGAFYLAEKFQLDIIPILIHGNAEVLPKGSFIIRDGSITIDILPRITPDNQDYGATYTERAKGIGAYFRNEFRRFRNQIEDEYYWQKNILEEYRYKSDTIYKAVKEDLNTNKITYQAIINLIGQKDSVLHLSKDYGQLDLLLSSDSIDRKIYTYLDKTKARNILKNSFRTKNYSKIQVLSTTNEALEHKANVLILDSSYFKELEYKIQNEITILILLKSGKTKAMQHALEKGFSIHNQSDNFIALKRTKV